MVGLKVDESSSSASLAAWRGSVSESEAAVSGMKSSSVDILEVMLPLAVVKLKSAGVGENWRRVEILIRRITLIDKT